MKKTELLNRIATLLGGRAAEEIVFGDISTGAHNDLSRATDIARSMVKEYGMSDRLGQVYFAGNNQNRFLNLGSENRAEYGEVTADLIDKEVQRIIDEQYKNALNILRKQRHILERAVKDLMKNEVIEGEELMALRESIRNETDREASAKTVQPVTLAA
jgi:cell division protease FtsH